MVGRGGVNVGEIEMIGSRARDRQTRRRCNVLDDLALGGSTERQDETNIPIFSHLDSSFIELINYCVL